MEWGREGGRERASLSLTPPAESANKRAQVRQGSEAGSYLRRIDPCTTQLKARGPSRTCNESKEEEEVTPQKFTRGTLSNVINANSWYKC